MSTKKQEVSAVLPTTKEELEGLLSGELKKRQKLEFEKQLGKLKKPSELVEIRKRIARIKTKIREQRTENREQKEKRAL